MKGGLPSGSDSLPDPEAPRVGVDTVMEAYGKKSATEEAQAEEEEGVPDAEGWVEATRLVGGLCSPARRQPACGCWRGRSRSAPARSCSAWTPAAP